MEFEAFNKKSVVDNKVVMTEATMVFKPGVDVIGVHIVTEEEAGRPDIMSWTFYKTPHKVDLILKWNGISNPFSIEAGTEIEIPILISTFKKFIKPSRPSEETQKDKFIAQRRMTEKDVKRLEFIQQKAAKYNTQALPPNMIKDGQQKSTVVGPARLVNGPLDTDTKTQA
jgi:hypothetical protein